MYVTQSYLGKPYQAYVPDTIKPRFDPKGYGFWQDLDSWLIQNSIEQEFDERLPLVVDLKFRSKSAIGLKGVDAKSVVREAMLAKTVDEREVKSWNRLLTNGLRQAYRDGVGFVGSSDPALAWHIGSPKEKIPLVMSKLLSFQGSSLPVTYVAIVSLMRMLAVHPFIDGNGRTARLYSAWLIRKSLAPSPLFLDIIESLWDREKVNLHYAAELIKTEENWDYLFGAVQKSLEVKVRKY